MHRVKDFFSSSPQGEVRRVDFARASEDNPAARPTWCRDPQDKVQAWWPHSRAAVEPQAPQVRVDDPEVMSQGVPAQASSPALEAAFEEARARGFEAGLEEGRQGAEVEAEAALAQELEALRSMTRRFAQELDAVGRLRHMMMDEAEAQMVALALDVGQRMACEAQLGSTQWVAPLVRQAAEALTEADRVICRLSPALAVRMDKDEAWPDIQGMVFEIAPELDELDIVVESRFGRVDASFRERLEHLERAVRERVEKALVPRTEQDAA